MTRSTTLFAALAATLLLFSSGCVTLYEYREIDEQPLGELCTEGFDASDPLLLESSCGADLTTYTGQAACEAGDGAGCTVAALGALGGGSISEAMESGKVEQDTRRSEAYAERGCDRGNESSCMLQVNLLMRSGSQADAARALQLMDRKCRRADMGGVCHAIGMAFKENARANRDRKRAFDYLEMSCDTGHAAGCYQQGKAFEEGFGTSQSQTRAKLRYEEACKKGHQKACDEIGEEPGKTDRQLLVEQVNLTKISFVEMGQVACKSGFRHACTFVGRLVDRGELQGRFVDDQRADTLYETGCAKGAWHSCYYLARRIKRRDGSVYQVDKGVGYAKRACEHGVEAACPLQRDLMGAAMAEEDAEALAERCTSGGEAEADEEAEAPMPPAQACYVAGEAFRTSNNFPGDARRALQLHRAGCQKGEARACWRAGRLASSEELEADDVEARPLFKRACDGGFPEGCFAYGMLLREADEPEAAVAALEKACTGGEGAACGELADYYEAGEVVDKDPAKTERYHREGCRVGDVESCTSLALFYLEETQTTESVGRALKLLKISCRQQEGRACAHLGIYASQIEDGPFEKEPKDYLEKACLSGSGLGCAVFGEAYQAGSFVDEDLDKARQLYEQSCDLDSAAGCTKLGELYRYGNGVDRDSARAGRLFAKACDDDYGRGCSEYAEMKFYDPDHPYEPKRAAELLTKACGTGRYDACQRLSLLYLDGIHLEKSVPKAVATLEAGCESGAIRACTDVSHWLRTGTGVKADAERAEELADKYAEARRTRCEEYDDEAACIDLAHHMAHGRGADSDGTEAREFLRKRCDEGMGSVCYEMARLQARGMIFPRNYTEGIEELRSTCNAGNSYACAEAAQFMRRADSEHQELSRAADYNRKGCDGKGSLACRQLGRAYLHGVGVDAEPERAAELLADTCNEAGDLSCLGYADALVALKYNDKVAVLHDWSTTACQRKAWPQCTVAGRLAASGIGTDRDLDRAVDLYGKACRSGGLYACSVGEALERLRAHQGSAPSPADCSEQKADACVLAGTALLFGVDRALAPDRAAETFERGCRAGSGLSCKLRLSLDILERVPLTGDAFYTYADKACEAGGAADCYAAGRRVAAYKFDRGAGLVRRACRKEEVRACLWLAMRGQSVE